MLGILNQRDIVRHAGKSYRILQIDDYDIITIEMNTPKTIVRSFDRKSFENNICNGVSELKVEKQKNVRYIHPEMLQGASLRIYNQFKNTGEDFLKYSECYSWLLDKEERAHFIQSLAEKNNISLATARRRLRDYLQNGMALRGLESKYYNCGGKGKERVFKKGSRPGRKGFSSIVRDEETIEIFDKMNARYIAFRGEKSIASLYKEMVYEYYTEKVAVGAELHPVPYSLAAMPSRRQLYYHISKRNGPIEDYVMRNGYKDARNNIRPLQSDTICALDHQTIGDCYEVDEMETDYELVSSYDRNHVIGRGVMYLSIDVFSKMITGYSIGIDNNSWSGVEMLLLNMAEDKVQHCSERGVQITEEDWPVSYVLPRQIMVDNGSEYLSKQFGYFGLENGVCLSFAESRMGSMKGNIEGEFRRFNLKTKGLLPGRISKDIYRNPHEKKARLTIEEFEQIVIRFILNHNKNPMDSYKANKEIFSSGIVQSPNNIWEYCSKQSNQLRKITDMDTYRLSIMCTGNARITREGIQFQKMIYSCEDMNWLAYEMGRAAVEKTKKLEIKFDKRCMDTIYYLAEDGTYKVAFLNTKKTINEKYMHLSYDDVLAVEQKQRKMRIENKREQLKNDLEFIGQTKAIVKQSEKLHKGVNSNKNKRQHRDDTKARLHKEHNIVSKIGCNMREPSSQTINNITECVDSIEQVKQKRLLELMKIKKGNDNE